MSDHASLSRSDSYALKTLLFLLALSALMQVLLASEGDKDWLLLAARMWLDGKRLYVGVVEVNPPLIIWLYGLAVHIAGRIVWLRDYQVLGIMGLLATAASVRLCVYLIRLHPQFVASRRKRIEFTLLLSAIFVFLVPPAFFFDREHILLLFTFPYIVRFMPSLARQKVSLPLQVGVGIMAAAGFCIKPHALLLFAGLQLLYGVRERSARILGSAENIVIYLLGALYLLCLWQLTPEYLSLILPMALETYFAFNRGGSMFLCLPPALFCTGLTFADFRPRHTTPYRRDVYYFVLIVPFLLVHALISNGWDYTYQPLMTLLLFLSGWVCLEYQWLKNDAEAHGLVSKPFLFGMRGCFLSLASQGIYMAISTIVSINIVAMRAQCERHPECLERDVYTHYIRQHDIHSFGTITLAFTPWVTVVHRSGARWETRFNHLWMLPGLLEQYRAGDTRHAWIEQYVARALAQDLNERKPEVVFVDVSRQFFAYPDYIDLVKFLQGTPEFRQAWGGYRYTTTIDRCNAPETSMFKNACKYDIYSRNP